MALPDRQPRSGLATIRRDFSSNKMADSSPASSLSVPRRSTLSDSLRKVIQDGVASREAEKTSHGSSSDSQKRTLQSSASPYGSSQSSLFSTASTIRSDSTFSDHESARTSKPVPKPDIQLSYEQKQVLELVKQKKNVFYTGSAALVSRIGDKGAPQLILKWLCNIEQR
ncbi:hypothetical protein EDB87DRAFT_430153 [Lactarius vividus]|nr:hypothetical protein EDB87DRAFT_430153 [Lactarius vividus]